MKDKQPIAKTPTGSIPVISPVLHVLSMPVLVILRHSFGYSFLSPKSIFLSSIFATCLLSYIVWHDEAFRHLLPLAAFGLFASLLYVIRLVSSIIKQAHGTAEHDQYSGTSYLLSLVVPETRAKYEGLIHNVAEPAIILVTGYFSADNPLGRVLIICGFALAGKELIRAWLSIRHVKRMEDNLDDAKETMEATQSSAHSHQPLATTGRTNRERYRREYESDDENSIDSESDYAKELRLMPPYTLEKAEENFATLAGGIKLDSENAKQQLERLNQAIQFFRNRFNSDSP